MGLPWWKLVVAKVSSFMEAIVMRPLKWRQANGIQWLLQWSVQILIKQQDKFASMSMGSCHELAQYQVNF